MISVTAVNNRLYSYGKSKLCKALTPSQKWSGDVISHTWNCGTPVYFIAYSEDKFISQFLLDYISAIIT